jgi:hypothetical protein
MDEQTLRLPSEDEQALHLMGEEPLTPTQAARLVPARRGGSRGVHRDTIVRWLERGHGGVKLEGYRTPSGWVTSKEALARFVRQFRPGEPKPTPGEGRTRVNEGTATKAGDDRQKLKRKPRAKR